MYVCQSEGEYLSAFEQCMVVGAMHTGLSLSRTAMLTVSSPFSSSVCQLLMERLAPQGALTELLAWVGETEARLEEQRDRVHQTTSTNANLNLVLQSFKVATARFSLSSLIQYLVM